MKTLLAALALALAAAWTPASAASALPPEGRPSVDHPSQGGFEMPYAARADLVDRFGADEIDVLAPLAEGASPRADAALADAHAEIDAALAETWTLPLTGDWPALKAVCCDLARAMLYDDDAPERVLGALASARKRLGRIGRGEMRLVDAAGRIAARRPAILIDPGGDAALDARLDEYLNA